MRRVVQLKSVPGTCWKMFFELSTAFDLRREGAYFKEPLGNFVAGSMFDVNMM